VPRIVFISTPRARAAPAHCPSTRGPSTTNKEATPETRARTARKKQKKQTKNQEKTQFGPPAGAEGAGGGLLYGEKHLHHPRPHPVLRVGQCSLGSCLSMVLSPRPRAHWCTCARMKHLQKCSKSDLIRRPNPVPPPGTIHKYLKRTERAARSMLAHRGSRT